MMRPLWYEFPLDEATYGREGISMVGNSLLVAPVLTKGATQGQIWAPNPYEKVATLTQFF